MSSANPKAEPTIMYHVSASENRSSITEHGLLVDFDQTGHAGIFLADAEQALQRGFDIWAVDVSGLEIESDWTGEPEEGEWWVHWEDIAPTRIALVELAPKPNPSPSR
jgi:hypothetical protein